MGVDDDLSDAGFLQFIERLAVGAEAYLYENSVQGQVVLGIGCAVLQAEGSYLFAIANDGVVKGLDDVQHVCEEVMNLQGKDLFSYKRQRIFPLTVKKTLLRVKFL